MIICKRELFGNDHQLFGEHKITKKDGGFGFLGRDPDTVS
jgi:hypothetical protein